MGSENHSDNSVAATTQWGCVVHAIIIGSLILLFSEGWALYENVKRINSLAADNVNRAVVVSKGKARVVVECQSRTRKMLKRLGIRCPKKGKL